MILRSGFRRRIFWLCSLLFVAGNGLCYGQKNESNPAVAGTTTKVADNWNVTDTSPDVGSTVNETYSDQSTDDSNQPSERRSRRSKETPAPQAGQKQSSSAPQAVSKQSTSVPQQTNSQPASAPQTGPKPPTSSPQSKQPPSASPPQAGPKSPTSAPQNGPSSGMGSSSSASLTLDNSDRLQIRTYNNLFLDKMKKDRSVTKNKTAAISVLAKCQSLMEKLVSETTVANLINDLRGVWDTVESELLANVSGPRKECLWTNIVVNFFQNQVVVAWKVARKKTKSIDFSATQTFLKKIKEFGFKCSSKV